MSNSGKDFWYTEYRAYIGGKTTKIDYFYLRADHKSKTSQDITGFQSEWWPYSKFKDRMDFLDPMPLSKSRTEEVSISIPLGITWTTSINSNVRVDSTFNPEKDRAEWYVTNPAPIGWYRSPMPEFQFTQGTHIEAERSMEGFAVNVRYNIWKGDADNIDTPPWRWWDDRYTIQ